MNFGDLVQASDVVIGVRASDVSAAAAQLLEETLSRRKFPPEEITRLVNAVMEREREAPTLCGPIAIPHARDAAIQSFLAAVAINPDGIIEGSASPRVMISFLSPDNRRSEHLALLASLARLSRDRSAIDALASARGAEEAIDVLRSRDVAVH